MFLSLQIYQLYFHLYHSLAAVNFKLAENVFNTLNSPSLGFLAGESFFNESLNHQAQSPFLCF